jgi:hypothetical protein
MAYVTAQALGPLVAAKFVDKKDGWPNAPTGQMTRESDGKVMSVSPDPNDILKCVVTWVDASNYSMHERCIYRKDKIDFWPNGYDTIGYNFGIGEP